MSGKITLQELSQALIDYINNSGGGNTEISLNQITKLNITTSKETATDEPFTSVFDSPIDLVYEYIEEGSEVVTSADKVTTYINGTDYEINYKLGRITVLSTGNMVDATDYLISYSYLVPHEVIIDIPNTDFKRLPIEVLKFVEAGTDDVNVLQTIATFDNADVDDFEPNPLVEFNGTMHLKTNFIEPMTDEGMLVDYTTDLINGTITFDNVRENSEIGEVLNDSGDGLTFSFTNKPLKSGNVVVYDNGVDVTGSTILDLENGTVTFASTPTGPVTADYIWIESGDHEVIGESPTTTDNLTYQLNHSNIADDSLTVYSNGISISGKLWSKVIDLGQFKVIENIEVI